MIMSFVLALLQLVLLFVSESGALIARLQNKVAPSRALRSFTSSLKPCKTRMAATILEESSDVKEDSSSFMEVPKRGLIDYIGSTARTDGEPRWSTHTLTYTPPSASQLFKTRYKLWRQLPWKKIKGKAAIKIKLQGALPLESPQAGGLPFRGPRNFDPVNSLTELMTILTYAAYDPRVTGIYVELGPLACGYGKLQEARRLIDFFKQSGKEIIGFAEVASEKELYLAMGFTEFYVPPDGALDLRGFSGSASFVRGVFEKIGVEPQVQRIGKYKSFGDTFNRTEISEAQREVVSALLTEASDFWVDAVAEATNQTAQYIRQIWAESEVQSPYDYKQRGLITGVRYKDQVDLIAKERFSTPKKAWFGIGGGSTSQEPEEARTATTATDDVNSTAVSLTEGEPELASDAQNMTSTSSESEAVVIDNQQSSDELIEDEAKEDFELEADFVKFPRRKSGLNATEMFEFLNSTGLEVPSTLTTSKFSSSSKSKKSKKPKRSNKVAPSLVPAGLYLRKMRKGGNVLQGLPVFETRMGPRIGIINAAGGITSGESSSGGLNGPSVGSDTLIAMIREAKFNPAIKAVVLRIDSPGGSALASDLMWRELRSLSRVKPVVASQVDVAASGGYYLSMACDEIVSEELTVTGSIGVVTSMFNAEKLNEKIGFNSETISIGRYAELFSTSRGFTDEEESYFEASAQKFYKSFITKAAASRSMEVDALHEVAQGRVWTGRQALQQGLTDHMGGLWRALELAANMSCYHLDPKLKIRKNAVSEGQALPIRIQTIRAPRSGFGVPLFGASTTATAGATAGAAGASQQPLALCDDIILGTGLVSPESFGVSPLLQKLGLSPVATAILRSSGLDKELQRLSQQLLSASAATSSTDGVGAVGSLLNGLWSTLLEGFELVMEDL